MKYIIGQIGGKQYILKQNEWYKINFIPKSKIGDYLLLSKILLFKKIINLQIGLPFLTNGKILGKIILHLKASKLRILKTKPKKNYTRLKGHRQLYTYIQIIY